MQLSEVILTLTQVSGVLFVLASMFAMGLSLTIPMIAASLSDVKLVVLALIANFVIVPRLVWPKFAFARATETP